MITCVLMTLERGPGVCSVQNLPVVPREHLPGVSDAAGLLLPRGDQVNYMLEKFANKL